MATTTITGTINGVNNTALANKWITFRLVQLGTDSGATATVAQSVDSVQTDANGDFSIDVWNNGDSGKTSVLEITIDGSKPESVIIPAGTVSIELWDLIENYQADGSTSEQVPVVSDLFLRKSSNLSDIGNKIIASQNLDLEIGVDVQAHSATLDATTASFTTADETKLDGIEALADVTDATNIAASGGYVAGGTDVALTDGGTGASDAPTARTNLGVAIGSDVQAHSAVLDATTASFLSADEAKLDGIEALADVTDATNIAANGGYVAGGTDVALTDGGTGASDATTARTNLGVPSSAEAVLVANNLSEVDPVIARANLGVPSSQEGLAAANNLSELTLTASTARTNIGVPSNAEAVLVANNLSDVDPVIARANLGVPATNEGLSAANNLSELTPTSSTARTNLGVAIGTDVQAHSAVLDATDASFTTARDSAISANAANIASNDTDIGFLTGSVAQNQADITTNAAAIALNTAKVTNATHTGDVTGSTTLTIANDAVDIAKLSATGTPDATSFLRGDNTWSVPAGGAGGDVGTDAIWDAKGDLAGGIGPNAATRLPLGTDLQVLTVNSAEATGMEWTTLPSGAGGVATDPVWDAKGDIAGGTGLDAATRLAVGTNAQVLTADSAEATGMKWATPESVATDPIWDTKGDLAAGTGADASSRLSVGTDAQVLTADSAEATGMKWATPTPTPVEFPYTTAFFVGSSQLQNFSIIDNLSGYNSNLNLESIYIGSKVTTIDFEAFKGALSFNELIFSSGLTAIGVGAFVNCVGLANVIIPENVTSVGDNAFEGCNNLLSCVLPDNLPAVPAAIFKDCSLLASFTIPSSATAIGASAFINSTSLLSISIPAIVTSIGATAFTGCTALSDIKIYAETAPTIGAQAFLNCSATVIKVPTLASGYASSYDGIPVEFSL